jgi:pimeloyl-ACP methyl ester carboxylesterase
MACVKLSSGVSVEYEVKGAGPPIVLLPGLGNRRFIWGEVAQALEDSHRVYTCEFRGYGTQWEGTSFGIKDLADDVARFIRELEIADPVVMGHSQGGFVLLELALAHPTLLRGLVLLASASYTDEYGRTLLRLWRSLADKGDTQLLIDELFLWNFSWHFCNERTREMRMLKAMIRKSAFDLRAFALHTLACESHETRDRIAAITAPTLLLGGELDIVMTQRHNQILAGLIPHSELVTLPRVGHNLLAEAPDALIAPIRGFLDRVGAGARHTSRGDAA